MSFQTSEPKILSQKIQIYWITKEFDAGQGEKPQTNTVNFSGGTHWLCLPTEIGY